MKSIIICEGSTDYSLLQYFMRGTYGWQDNAEEKKLKKPFKLVRSFKKDEDTLI